MPLPLEMLHSSSFFLILSDLMYSRLPFLFYRLKLSENDTTKSLKRKDGGGSVPFYHK